MFLWSQPSILYRISEPRQRGSWSRCSWRRCRTQCGRGRGHDGGRRQAVQFTDPNIIPIAFSDSVVEEPGVMAAVLQTQRLHPSAMDSGEQYRIIPEVLSDGAIHEETTDSFFSPGPPPPKKTFGT